MKHIGIFINGIVLHDDFANVEGCAPESGPTVDAKRPGRRYKYIENNAKVVKRFMKLIAANPSVSRATLAKKLKISERQVRNLLRYFVNNGTLVRQGKTTGKWVIVQHE